MSVTCEDIAHRCRQVLTYLEGKSSSSGGLNVEVRRTLQQLIDLHTNIDSLSVSDWQTTHRHAAEDLIRLLRDLIDERCSFLSDVSDLPHLHHFLDLIYEDLSGVTVAVRSAGTLEDTPLASLAGQHETYLNIRTLRRVRHAVKLDWASNHTERVIAYRDEQIMHEFARHNRTGELFPILARRLEAHPEMQVLLRFFALASGGTLGDAISPSRSSVTSPTSTSTHSPTMGTQSLADTLPDPAIHTSLSLSLPSPSLPRRTVSAKRRQHPLISSLRLLKWLERPESWRISGEGDEDAARAELLGLLKQYRHLFMHPDYAEMAVIIQKQSVGTDLYKPSILRTAAAFVFSVDTTTGFTGRMFGTNRDGENERRSRLFLINSTYGWGEALAQGDVTADLDTMLAYDDSDGKRRYILLRQMVGPKKRWTASLDDARDAINTAELLGNNVAANSIRAEVQIARAANRHTVSLAVPPELQRQFVLSNSEKLSLVSKCDRAVDMCVLREFLRWIPPKKLSTLAEAMFVDGVDEATVRFFAASAHSTWVGVNPEHNHLAVLWNWIFTRATPRIKSTYMPFLQHVVKGIETSLPLNLGVRSVDMLQCSDFLHYHDNQDPQIFVDERTVVDVDALRKCGISVVECANGFLIGKDSTGTRGVFALIGSPSTTAVSTSTVATGAISVLRRDTPQLPEHQILTLPTGGPMCFLVADKTTPRDLVAMKKSLGVVTFSGTKTSHAAVESLSLHVASVVGVQYFLEKMRAEDSDRADFVESVLNTDGVRITVDGNNGIVYLAHDPKPLLLKRLEALQLAEAHEEAARLAKLIEKFCVFTPVEIPVRKVSISVDIKRLPRLQRKIGWIMSNHLEAWRATKLSLAPLMYGLCVLRAETSARYVGVATRALVAYDFLFLTRKEAAKSLSPAESESLNQLRIMGLESEGQFSQILSLDAQLLSKHPQVVEEISRRISGFTPPGWTAPSAIFFYKQTHSGIVCSISAASPHWQKKNVSIC
eukprot:TRINITY_DN10249_c0_g1_i2.p1 TRINITY_DN10249_c0_g1~~TRINITY_DN10249_c0_g1_i2.p1  ORF type:complete len:999 (+),score=179.99 TRINITY_DN10249_c0_g1_i2:381-3377(+)